MKWLHSSACRGAFNGRVWPSALVLTTLALGVLVSYSWGAVGGLVIRSLGLSRTGDTTMLMVMLNQPADARVTAVSTGGKPQLILDFFQGQAERLPSQLAGDHHLVETVRTEVSPVTKSVRIFLDLYPDRPYSYLRQSRSLGSGQYAFLLGLKTEGKVAEAPKAPPAPAPAPPAAPAPAVASEGRQPWRAEAPLRHYTPAEPGSSPSLSPRFAEVGRLLPKAASLLHYLETEGWVIRDTEDFDRPGQRVTRGFYLESPKYPEMLIKIAQLPASAPGAPNIGIATLSMERLKSPTADEYRQLRKWSFSQIKQKYEDIGDFFDEALKPLRLKLRQECQQLAQRHAPFLKQYLAQAFPGNPQVAEEAMKHIQQKINPRFEGVQYTISENPLGILNLVDFLFVRVYYLEDSF